VQASNLTQPFWTATREGRLVRQVCDACGKSFFTPQIACPDCRSQAWQWQQSSGRGEVYSKSTVNRSPRPKIAAPYVIAIVQLEEGWDLLTNIVNCGAGDVHIGMRVQVVFQREWEGNVVPEFEPEGVPA